MSCCHHFAPGVQVCRNCDGDAVAILGGAVKRLDSGARAALGFLVNGQRDDAEKALRAALIGDFIHTIGAHEQLTLDGTEATS